MRIIAAIYLTIVVVNFGLWLSNGNSYDFQLSARVLLVWGLYLFLVLALLAYVIGKRILPRRLWQVVFVIYLSTRLLEWVSYDIAITGDNVTQYLNILANYLWLVLPGGLAMWYLGFGGVDDAATIRQKLMTSLTTQESAPEGEIVQRMK
ncbi:MAG: hypothetical protein R3E64_02770 [Halioglobus sp.]